MKAIAAFACAVAIAVASVSLLAHQETFKDTVQINENISVTVDHDVDVNRALVMRLDAAK